MSDTGCFGKVPAHGDFVWQGLPAGFVTPWDTWLQEQLLALQEQCPQDWLEVYLCSPIWRFLIRDDALGHQTWGGIISPSVDIVGRYFPFTIATALPCGAPISSSTRKLSPWQAHAEEVVLAALAETLSIEEVLLRVRSFPVAEICERLQDDSNPAPGAWSGQVTGGDSWAEQLLDELIISSFDHPCHWSRVDIDSGEVTYQMTNGFQQFGQLFTA